MHKSEIPAVVAKHQIALAELCKQFLVKELYLFGSGAKSTLSDQSDLDFLVTFGKVKDTEYAEVFFDFRDALERLFSRKIDLVESQALKNPYFKANIEATKIKVYGRRSRAEVAI